jgi:endonuclease YncB( thermonuclease family)
MPEFRGHDKLASWGKSMISRIATMLLLSALSVGAVSSTPIASDEVRVIDGDTIRIHHQKPDVRLVGFNAPETRRAICEAERELGGRATGRLRDLVQSSQLEFEFVACACPPGKEGTPFCNYGRRCGTLKADGQDVGLILIRENLAVPFVCGQTRCPPTPKPWCK